MYLSLPVSDYPSLTVFATVQEPFFSQFTARGRGGGEAIKSHKDLLFRVRKKKSINIHTCWGQILNVIKLHGGSYFHVGKVAWCVRNTLESARKVLRFFGSAICMQERKGGTV